MSKFELGLFNLSLQGNKLNLKRPNETKSLKKYTFILMTGELNSKNPRTATECSFLGQQLLRMFTNIIFFFFKKCLSSSQLLSEVAASTLVLSEPFCNHFRMLVDVGICVTAPPLTAGLQVRSTVAVMASHTPLL